MPRVVETGRVQIEPQHLAPQRRARRRGGSLERAARRERERGRAGARLAAQREQRRPPVEALRPNVAGSTSWIATASTRGWRAACARGADAPCSPPRAFTPRGLARALLACAAEARRQPVPRPASDASQVRSHTAARPPVTRRLRDAGWAASPESASA